MLHSMETCPGAQGLHLRWSLIFDTAADIPAYLRAAVSSTERTEIRVLVYGRGKSKYGIPQKNMGIEASAGCWFLILDDDTILHPRYLSRISEEIARNPNKRAFVHGQRRWDSIGSLKALPERLIWKGVDNGMVTLHTDLVGTERHDPNMAGMEDAAFVQGLHERHPDGFHFIDEELSYYNYLDVARIPDWQSGQPKP